MSWNRLELALATIDPQRCGDLHPGASSEALDQLELDIGRKLPEEFRRAWAIHDGMREPVFAMLEFLNTREIASEWRGLRDYDDSSGGLEAQAHGPVKALWTSPDWIPFVLIGGETRHFCIDLDPAVGGRRGQIIHATPKWEERRVIAPGVDALLEMIAAALREGRCEIGDDIDVSEALFI